MRFVWFIFAAIGALAALVTTLTYFGVSSDRLSTHMAFTALPSVWWLVAAVCLFVSSFGFSVYGMYRANRLSPLAESPRESRRLLIQRWRAMVTEVHGKMLATFQRRAPVPASAPDLPPKTRQKSVTELLEAHPDFPSLRPYLSDDARHALHGRTFVVPPDGSAMDGNLHRVLDEIDRLEQEWGLR